MQKSLVRDEFFKEMFNSNISNNLNISKKEILKKN